MSEVAHANALRGTEFRQLPGRPNKLENGCGYVTKDRDSADGLDETVTFATTVATCPREEGSKSSAATERETTQ